MTPEAVAWLREAVTERKALAEAAMATEGDDGVWHTEDDGDSFTWAREVRGAGIHIYDEGGHDKAQAAHIAANDPRQILADCIAQLVVIQRLECVHAAFHDPVNGTYPDVSRRERSHAEQNLADIAHAYRFQPGWAEHWSD